MRFLRRVRKNWSWPRAAGWATYFWVTDYVLSLHRSFWVRVLLGALVGMAAAAIAFVVVSVIEERIRRHRES
jgi:hypothetical protein